MRWSEHDEQMTRVSCECYLGAASQVEPLQLVDGHRSFAVSHQDTVALRRQQHGSHLHPGGCGLCDRRLQAEGERHLRVRESERNTEEDHWTGPHMLWLRSQISS